MSPFIILLSSVWLITVVPLFLFPEQTCSSSAHSLSHFFLPYFFFLHHFFIYLLALVVWHRRLLSYFSSYFPYLSVFLCVLFLSWTFRASVEPTSSSCRAIFAFSSLYVKSISVIVGCVFVFRRFIFSFSGYWGLSLSQFLRPLPAWTRISSSWSCNCCLSGFC